MAEGFLIRLLSRFGSFTLSLLSPFQVPQVTTEYLPKVLYYLTYRNFTLELILVVEGSMWTFPPNHEPERLGYSMNCIHAEKAACTRSVRHARLFHRSPYVEATVYLSTHHGHLLLQAPAAVSMSDIFGIQASGCTTFSSPTALP